MDTGELDVVNRDLKAALKVWKLALCAGGGIWNQKSAMLPALHCKPKHLIFNLSFQFARTSLNCYSQMGDSSLQRIAVQEWLIAAKHESASASV
jgi:hypothetical protein